MRGKKSQSNKEEISTQTEKGQAESKKTHQDDQSIVVGPDEEKKSEEKTENNNTNDLVVSQSEIQHAIALATEAASKTFGWGNHRNKDNKNGKDKRQLGPGNELTNLIPGYTAPLSLDSSALDKYKGQSKKSNISIASSSAITKIDTNPSTSIGAYSSSTFKHQSRSAKNALKSKTNAGEKWFNMESTPKTKSLMADVAIIRNRTYLDPKRFYKSSEFKNGKDANKILQLGTVIEGATESVFTNRLTKKERKSTFMEEMMGEVFTRKDDYIKKTYGKLQREKSAQGKRRGGGNRSGGFKKRKFN